MILTRAKSRKYRVLDASVFQIEVHNGVIGTD
jgi:hypothetical protein